MEGCFMFQWGGRLFFRWGSFILKWEGASVLVWGGWGSQKNHKMWGTPSMPLPLWEILFWCLKRFYKKYTVTNLVKPEISVSNFFNLVSWGKMCQNIKNTASCSRKLKIKETFEKVSHDFSCKVALGFHSWGWRNDDHWEYHCRHSRVWSLPCIWSLPLLKFCFPPQ